MLAAQLLGATVPSSVTFKFAAVVAVTLSPVEPATTRPARCCGSRRRTGSCRPGQMPAAGTVWPAAQPVAVTGGRLRERDEPVVEVVVRRVRVGVTGGRVRADDRDRNVELRERLDGRRARVDDGDVLCRAGCERGQGVDAAGRRDRRASDGDARHRDTGRERAEREFVRVGRVAGVLDGVDDRCRRGGGRGTAVRRAGDRAGIRRGITGRADDEDARRVVAVVVRRSAVEGADRARSAVRPDQAGRSRRNGVARLVRGFVDVAVRCTVEGRAGEFDVVNARARVRARGGDFERCGRRAVGRTGRNARCEDGFGRLIATDRAVRTVEVRRVGGRRCRWVARARTRARRRLARP